MATEKELYQQKLEAQLDQWNAEIDKLKAQGEELEADAKIDYYRKLEELSVKREEIAQKLKEIKKAGDDTWETIKLSAGSLMIKFQEEFEQVQEQLKKSRERALR